MTAVRPSWDEYYLAIAQTVSSRADCTRRQVGAVAVDVHNRLVGAGYNGAPSGQPGCLTDGACPRGQFTLDEFPAYSTYDSGAGLCHALHAELNCIVVSGSSRLRGGTLYVTDKPCVGCERVILASGLSRVVWPDGELVLT